MPARPDSRVTPVNVGVWTRAERLARGSPYTPPVSSHSRCPDYKQHVDDEERRSAFRVYGLITSPAFQRARICVEKACASMGKRLEEPIVQPMLDMEWDDYISEERRVHGGHLWAAVRGVAVWDGNYFVGDDRDLLNYVARNFSMKLPEQSFEYFFRMVEDYHEILSKPKSVFVTMDLRIENTPFGSLMFELFTSIVPVTCRNFLNLCKGEGEPNPKGKFYSYKGSRVHRIVKDGWIQCGDVTNIIGGGGHSSFANETFPDEARAVSHNKRGILSMCNKGPNTNQSQFFVTLASSTWMDRHYVAFGELVEGAEVLRMLESMRTFYECPMTPVVISACNVMETGTRFWPPPPSPRGTHPTPTASLVDLMSTTELPPAPPGIAAILAKQGPKLWEALRERFRDGPTLAERKEALAAAQEAAETVVEAALAVALAPQEAAEAAAEAALAAVVEGQEKSPHAAAKAAALEALRNVFAPQMAATAAARTALKRALGPSDEALAITDDIVRAAVDAAADEVARRHGGVLSVHDVRDVESVLMEERFLKGLYSLTVPDPIIWRAYDSCRDHLDPEMARILMVMLARRAAERYPCDDLSWLPPWMPPELAGPLAGMWSGWGTMQSLFPPGKRWTWTGQGTVELVDLATGLPVGLPSVAPLAYQVAEELLAELDRQEPVLQDHAKWAARVGEEVTKRICTAGIPARDKLRAAKGIAEEMLHFVMERVEDTAMETPGEIMDGLLDTVMSAVAQWDQEHQTPSGSASDMGSQSTLEGAGDQVKRPPVPGPPGTVRPHVSGESILYPQGRDVADALLDETVKKVVDGEGDDLKKKESVNSRLFDVLLGTDFCPGNDLILAYSALIAQELLKAIAWAAPGERPDLEKACDMFNLDGDEGDEGWGQSPAAGGGGGVWGIDGVGGAYGVGAIGGFGGPGAFGGPSGVPGGGHKGPKGVPGGGYVGPGGVPGVNDANAAATEAVTDVLGGVAEPDAVATDIVGDIWGGVADANAVASNIVGDLWGGDPDTNAVATGIVGDMWGGVADANAVATDIVGDLWGGVGGAGSAGGDGVGEGEEEEVGPCERRWARRLLEGGLRIAREVQMAAADVAFKYGVRTALPPSHLGFPPGDVHNLEPPAPEEKDDEDDGGDDEETIPPPTPLPPPTPSESALPAKPPRQLYRDRQKHRSKRSGVYRPPKPAPPARPGDDPSYFFPGLPGTHV